MYVGATEYLLTGGGDTFSLSTLNFLTKGIVPYCNDNIKKSDSLTDEVERLLQFVHMYAFIRAST